MYRLRVRWGRVFGVCAALAVVCLLAGLCTKPPLHNILLVITLFLVVGFVPLIMAIYFARGVMRIH